MPSTIVILGAGATKACGGPLTREILHGILQNKNDPSTKDRLSKLEQFLVENFHLQPSAKPEDYPGLPLLMSLLDLSIDRRQPFRSNWDVNAVAEIRTAVEMGVFDLLERRLVQGPTTNHYT